MPTQSIQSELKEFLLFASRIVEQGRGYSSVEELVKQWRQDSEYAAAVADVQQGIVDSAAGKAQSLSDAFAEVRRRLGITD